MQISSRHRLLQPHHQLDSTQEWTRVQNRTHWSQRSQNDALAGWELMYLWFSGWRILSFTCIWTLWHLVKWAKRWQWGRFGDLEVLYKWPHIYRILWNLFKTMSPKSDMSIARWHLYSSTCWPQRIPRSDGESSCGSADNASWHDDHWCQERDILCLSFGKICFCCCCVNLVVIMTTGRGIFCRKNIMSWCDCFDYPLIRWQTTIRVVRSVLLCDFCWWQRMIFHDAMNGINIYPANLVVWCLVIIIRMMDIRSSRIWNKFVVAIE